MQLAPYNFTIHYYKGLLNLADSLLHRLDYLSKQEVVEETVIGKLIPLFANKLAVAAVPRACKQCQVRGRDPYTESLIRVLSLQATTRSEARSAIDDLVLFVLEESVLLDAILGSSTIVKEKSSLLKLIQSA